MILAPIFSAKPSNSFWSKRYVYKSSGRSLSLNYTHGHLTSVVDNNASPARTITYEYAANNCLSKVTDADGNTLNYFYNEHKGIIQINTKRNFSYNITYDNDKRVNSIKGGDVDIVINYANNQTIITEQVNGNTQTTTYTYGNNENLIQKNGSCCGGCSR